MKSMNEPDMSNVLLSAGCVGSIQVFITGNPPEATALNQDTSIEFKAALIRARLSYTGKGVLLLGL
jgi:hypothetical protein